MDREELERPGARTSAATEAPKANPAGAAIDQYNNAWDTARIVGSFESELRPLLMLSTQPREAEGDVPTGALPMSLELAWTVAEIESEFEAFASVVLN